MTDDVNVTMAETLIAKALSGSCSYGSEKVLVGYVRTALDLMPDDKKGQFAIRVLGDIEDWAITNPTHGIEAKLILLEAVVKELMTAEDIERIDSAAKVLLKVELHGDDEKSFEKMLKLLFPSYSKNSAWRLLRLASLAESATSAFNIAAHTLVQSYPSMIMELATDNWEKYR